MTSRFDLIIEADYPSRTADLRLLDGDGRTLASHQVDFEDHPGRAPAGAV